VDDPRVVALENDTSLEAQQAPMSIPTSGKSKIMFDKEALSSLSQQSNSASGNQSFTSTAKQIIGGSAPKKPTFNSSKIVSGSNNVAVPPRKLREFEEFGIQVRPLKHNYIQGVIVSKIVSGTPAEKSGIAVNDVITHVANRPSRTIDEFKAAVEQSQGQTTVNIVRGPYKMKYVVQPVHIN
jgi:hypothetical protein